MKQKILYILVMITALIGGNGEAWAQTTSYVLNESAEKDWSTIGNSGNYTISGPAKTLTFDAKRTTIWGISSTDNFYAEYSTDGGSNWTRALTINVPKTDTWYSFSCEIPINSNQVRFITETGATGKKQIRNVKVTRATTLSAPSSVDMGEVKIGMSISAQVNVSFNNTTYNQTLTGSCDNSAFSVVSRSMGETGTQPVTVNFAPTTAGTHTGTITLSMNGVTAKFTVKGSAQDKGTPAFTWTLTNLATGREYTDFFTSTNTDTPVTFASSDVSIANVVDGKLVTSSKEGTATITVTQQGNDDWHEKSQSFTVNVSRPQNHLPLAVTESNWSVLTRNISGGSFGWDGGIQHHALAYGNREFEIAFEGIPDKLTFDHRVTDSNIDSEVKWTVYEAPDGDNFTEAWTTGTNNGTATVQLKPTTRYVRIKCYCIYYENVSNIQISELRYLTSTASSIDFGENVEGETVSQTFTVKHANAGYGVTLTSSNPNAFEVSPALLTTTGGDKMGEETITVTYKNNVTGSQSGTITIEDPSGSNAAITLNVTGSTLSNTLFLNPAETPNYDVKTYKRIVLERTLPMGYSTITLPFTYDIDNVGEEAFVAQLELVTHNRQDGYTLYFRKVADGIMQPNQPYVLYMPFEITNAEWGETAISTPDAQQIVKGGWTMHANYTPGFPMEGKYGLAGGLFRKGTAGSYLNAYTAYFVPPVATEARIRMAMLEDDGSTTYIDSIEPDRTSSAECSIFGIDGIRLGSMRQGVNIVRTKDGSVRKVMKR